MIMTRENGQQQNDTLPPQSATSSSDTARTVLHTQKHTLRLFLSNPSTRTPVVVLYVAALGGSLHAAVTTYFYLAIGASSTDIGSFGAIQSLGALLGGPVCGIVLDSYGPWLPISVTAVVRGQLEILNNIRILLHLTFSNC